MVSHLAVGKVLKELRNNDRIDQVEQNYIANIENDLRFSRQTISEAIHFLAKNGIVEINRDGRKKIIYPKV